VAGTLGTVGFFVALVLVIVVHEAAHFGVAKAFGIKVTEFFVGFGPRIWSFRRGETEYGLKAILAGGYVRIAGMGPYETIAPADLPRTFGAKPIWQRALVIVAGPTTHLALAFVLFALWIGLVGRPVPNSPLVAAVAPRLDGQVSPAAEAGLRPGDRIVRVGDLVDPTDVELVRYTREHVGEPVPFTIERDGRRFQVTLVPVLATVAGERVGRIGVLLGWARETAGPLGAVSGGLGVTWDSVVETLGNFGRVFGPQGIGRVLELLFTDAPRSERDPASVIGIGRVAAETAHGGAGDLLYLFAYVNVFIGLLNLIPLPPFDGGHLALLALEKVRGRAIDARKIVPVSVAVLAFFVVFSLSVMYLDLVKPISFAP
jgi:membrane-associated protease RseP (regulator of RpoE activity)